MSDNTNDILLGQAIFRSMQRAFRQNRPFDIGVLNDGSLDGEPPCAVAMIHADYIDLAEAARFLRIELNRIAQGLAPEPLPATWPLLPGFVEVG